MSHNKIKTQLIQKASTDPAFRQRLVDDPKETLSDLLGVTLPPGMTITVLEEHPGQHYLVLPPAPPAIDTLPLNELDLALVGGGRTLRPISTICGNGNLKLINHSAKRTSQSSC